MYPKSVGTFKFEIMNNIETQNNKGEIVMYQPDETIRLEVLVENETVWLNRQQMADLFSRDVKTVAKHINNALREELAGESVGAKFATTASDGKSYQVEYFNLDMILSVGYRVKSQRGVQFRKWSNKILKQYLLKGYAVNQRLEQLERRVSLTEEKIDFFVKKSLPPVEGIYSPITVNICKHNHDRFLIIDDAVYLFGASLKDAGKKLFAYIKMQETPASGILNIIR